MRSHLPTHRPQPAKRAHTAPKHCAAIAASLLLVIGCDGASTEPAPTPTDTPRAAPSPYDPSQPRAGMVHIPAGPFVRGSDANDFDARPAQTITLSAYWIDRYEVTVAQYAACVRADACAPPQKHGEGAHTWGWSGPKPDRLNHPINGVTWDQAQTYCTWAGKRLPTEAEWEKAARGDDGRAYPWGDDAPSCARAVIHDGGDGCGLDRTWPVGSKPQGVSPYGLHDTIGSVWEWTADWYHRDAYRVADPKTPDPKGPPRGADRVMRGGGWGRFGVGVRASARFRAAPGRGASHLGFRCARSG